MPQHLKIITPIEILKLENNSYHILVHAEVDGICGDFIIDTGASMSVMDKTLFCENDEILDPLNMKSGGISGDIDEVKIVRISEFKIGGQITDNTQIALIDMEYINELYMQSQSRKIIGLLGSDFCVKHRAIIDYGKKRLTFKVEKVEEE
ncbi:retroviral-like aspartic protease family protein [Odoribacter sp. OttesenSCG-928-J03]|nr:retroviral-like aspartic protease family protein [Odoribacter sp. OttesenSCG-928-J03]